MIISIFIILFSFVTCLNSSLESDITLTVPIVNIESLLSNSTKQKDETIKLLGEAIKKWGFFHIINHGIDEYLQQELLNVSIEFFESDITFKNSVRRDINNSRGYTDNELTKRLVDLKQVYDVGHKPFPDLDDNAEENYVLDGFNRWPNVSDHSNLRNFREIIELYYRKCTQLASILMDALLSSVDNFDETKKTEATEFFVNHTSLFRLNYYPKVSNMSSDISLNGEISDYTKFGVSRHTDAGALTILWHSSPGLEVYTGSKEDFNDGIWIPVDPVEKALTINIGDMFQVLSNGVVKAPEHRVRATSNSDSPRYSAVFFYNPSYESIIRPISNDRINSKYRPINWGYFRQQRFLGDFADFGKEIQIEDFYIAS